MPNSAIPWAYPLKVRLQNGLERIFPTVNEALDFLEHEWPLRRGERYQRAVKACRGALNRATPPAVARETFIAACLEAGMPAIMAAPLPYAQQKKAHSKATRIIPLARMPAPGAPACPRSQSRGTSQIIWSRIVVRLRGANVNCLPLL